MVNDLGIDVSEGGPSGAGWSQIAAFLRCPKEFQFKHLRGVTPLGVVAQPDPLAVGTLVHAGRAVYFGNGCRSDSGVLGAMEREFERSQTAPKPLTQPQLNLAKTIVTQYIEYWSRQMLPKVKAVEYMLGPSPLFEGDIQTNRTSRFDDISEYPEAGGKLCIGDLKTTSGSINSVVQEYSMHGQPLLNLLLYRQVAEGAARFGEVGFWLVDVIKKPDNSHKCKFERVPLPITRHMLEHYRASMIGWLRGMARTTRDGDAPRNYTACARSFGRGEKAGARACDYRELCMWGKGKAGSFLNAEGVNLADTEEWK